MKKLFLAACIVFFATALLFASGKSESADDISDNSASFDSISLSWEVSDSEILFTLAAETTGWVSVGFNPSQVMKDAQFIIGYVNASGEVEIRDDYGNGMFSHAPDTNAGGTDDIRLISGRESDGWTELVFALPIDSGDRYDSPLTPGETHKVLLAHGPDNKDDFRTTHSFRTSFNVQF